MEEEMNKLTLAIEDNPNLSESFKGNLVVLANTVIATFPQYDYSYFKERLSNLKIVGDNALDTYTSYNVGSNTLTMNKTRMLEDNVDVQNVFLQNMLSICTHKEEMPGKLRGFNDGMSKTIATMIVGDEGHKSKNVLEAHAVGLLSKVIGGDELLDSYMKDDINIVLESLSKSGIEENSFTALMEDMSLISDKEQISSEHFIAAEKKIIDMFSLKMNNDAMNGKITLEELKEKCEDFGGLMFSSDLELYAVYPGYFEMKDSKQLFDYAKMGMKSLEKTQQIIAEKETKSL